MSDNQITMKPEESYKIIRNSVLTAQSKVYTVVNSAMVQVYWEIGQEYIKYAEKMTEQNMVKNYYNIYQNN